MSYQAKIQQHEIDISDEMLANDIQFQSNEQQGYSAVLNGEKFDVDLVKIDEEAKHVVLRIKGKKYVFHLKDPVDLMLAKLGIKPMVAKKVNHLKAPMPGMILKLLVAEGQQVKQGDSLLVLEAMKMENVFKAQSDGMIKHISVVEKQTVEKGEELISFDA
jgi:biotin carboxyl carrier protein